MAREASVNRTTKETDISLKFNIDGTGNSEIDTGIGFFDHMLEGFAKHGFFDMELVASGDLAVDGHHTVEDVGIVLGTAIKKAVGDKKGIRRYGSCILPMDETLVLCAVDLSGRPYLSFDAEFTTDRVGYLETVPGIVNYTNEGVASWYDFAKAIQRLAGITDVPVRAILSDDFPTTAMRPYYSVLDKTRFKVTYNATIPHWEESLARCIARMKQADENQ